MSTSQSLFASLSQQAVFLVWGPPSHGPRSQVFARELGIRELHFVYFTTQRGWKSALIKYPYQAVQTLRVLFAKRPRVVLVQSPPSLAVLFVYLYCAVTGAQYVIDAHSAAFSELWLRPRWLVQHLARRAVTTIVTNTHYQQMINSWGAHSFVLHDIPTTFPRAETDYPVAGQFNIVVINTFSTDEPLAEILAAAAQLPDIQFYVTGRTKNARLETLTSISANVHLTDFLPNETYYALLDAAQAVLCLTTRNHTMQRGACEALWMGKPIVTSNWPLLRDYFCSGTVHVDNSTEAIVAGITKMRNQFARYAGEILALQVTRRQEWQEKITVLAKTLAESMSVGQ